jgi:hypothetical protein
MNSVSRGDDKNRQYLLNKVADFRYQRSLLVADCGGSSLSRLLIDQPPIRKLASHAGGHLVLTLEVDVRPGRI